MNENIDRELSGVSVAAELDNIQREIEASADARHRFIIPLVALLSTTAASGLLRPFFVDVDGFDYVAASTVVFAMLTILTAFAADIPRGIARGWRARRARRAAVRLLPKMRARYR